MSIYDDLPVRVSLSGKVRTIEEDIYGVDVDNPSKIRPYELLVPLQDAVQNFVPGVYIPVTEKGQANGVPTLDATGKVPPAQLPANPGNFLPLSGGTMNGDINMDGNYIESAAFISTSSLSTSYISSPGSDIKIVRTLDMENHKIVDVAKGTSTKDVATIDNINDHDVSPFAHADIRNLITALQGAYVIIGNIPLNTSAITETALNSRILDITGRSTKLGDVLIDLNENEWYFNGTNWNNLGQAVIALASALNDGLMTKEQYTKLFDLYTKAQMDVMFATKEALANKAVDFSVVNDTKYPTTKAVTERLLNLPITELNNHTLREVFEGGNKYLTSLNASDYEPAIAGWAVLSNVGNELKITRDTVDTIYYGNKVTTAMTLTNGNQYYLATYMKSNVSTNVNISLRQSPTGIQDSNVDTGLVSSSYGIKSRITTITNYLNARILQFQIVSSNTGIEIFHNAIKVIDQTSLGISTLTVQQMDYWLSVYQALLVSDTNAIFNLIAQNKSAIDTKANITQEAWITPTLINGFSSYSNNTMQYMKDSIGFVHIEGTLTGGTPGLPAFTLPIGYRPKGRIIVRTLDNAYAEKDITINELSGLVTGFGYLIISFKAV